MRVISAWIADGYSRYSNLRKLKFNNLKYNLKFNNLPNNIQINSSDNSTINNLIPKITYNTIYS